MSLIFSPELVKIVTYDIKYVSFPGFFFIIISFSGPVTGFLF